MEVMQAFRVEVGLNTSTVTLHILHITIANIRPKASMSSLVVAR
jgi:hypothetical protein